MKYDYIIIGAGMGGLSVANYLAKDILKSEGIDLKKDFNEYFKL